MKRWIVNSFCLLSLLVLTGSATIWVRSCFEWEAIDRWSSHRDSPAMAANRLGPPTSVIEHSMAWASGGVSFRRNRTDGLGLEFGPARWSYHHLPLPADLITTGGPNDHLNLQGGGFQLVYGVYKGEDSWGSYQRLILPLWVFLVTAIPPALWLRHRGKGHTRGFAVEVRPAAELRCRGG
jgi:hypothetical protein